MIATIYTEPGCRFGEMAKQFLSAQGIAYVERDVTTDESAVEELHRLGTLAVPIIVIKGHTVIGFNVEQLAEVLGE